MKITMYAIGSTGDVRPLLLLGRELKARGHEITIAAFDTFQSDAEKEGFAFSALSGDVLKMMDNIMKPGVNGINYLAELVKSLGKVVPLMLEDILKAGADADAMVCTFFGSMFYSVAEYYHIPCMQVQYAPVDPTSELAISSAPMRELGRWWNKFSYWLGYLLISLLEKRFVNAWRKKHGMSLGRLHTAPDYCLGKNRIPVVYALSQALLSRPKDWPDEIHMYGFWQQEEENDENLSP